MDSLDQKQKDFDERMKRKEIEERYVKFMEEKRKKAEAKQPPPKPNKIQKPTATIPRQPPEWVAVKGITMGGHLKQLNGLVEQYANQSKAAPAIYGGTAVGTALSKALARVAREISVVFQMLVRQMEMDNIQLAREMEAKGVSEGTLNPAPSREVKGKAEDIINQAAASEAVEAEKKLNEWDKQWQDHLTKERTQRAMPTRGTESQ